MKKTPRLFPVFVALSLFLASGPVAATAQIRVQVRSGSSAVVATLPGISRLPTAIASLAAPSAAPAPLVSVVPAAAAPTAPTVATQKSAATLNAKVGLELPNRDRVPDSVDASASWSEGIQRFDGGSGLYRRLTGDEQAKLDVALRGADNSPTFKILNDEFERQGRGYYLLDRNPNARYMVAAAVDAGRRRVVVLTDDLLNRDNGRPESIYRGAPWEFIASAIAREQVLHNSWYDAIPASAEKLAASFMNMTRVFVDLTNGTSRSWATDKDYQAVAGDRSSYVQWNWFEQLVAAARAAALGVGTKTGHLIESEFFSWVRDWTAPQDKASVPAFRYSLWEQFGGTYYRPGDAKNGSPLPANAPRINLTAYDRAAHAAYGADGKGSAKNGGLDRQTVYGWTIQWLKDRFEI